MDLNKQILLEALTRKVFHFAPAPTGELTELSNLFTNKTIPRHSMLVTAGARWNRVFYIQKGVIRLFYSDNKGREFNKGFFWEDQLVWPIVPYARNNDSLFAIAALEELSVSVCPFTMFHSWLTGHGYWERFALPYVEAFAEQKFLREYEFLTFSATERFQHFCRDYPGLVGRIPDYHIASYIGVTNVALSRIKNSSNVNLC